MSLEIIQIKNCRKYTRLCFRTKKAVDDSFLQFFSYLGIPQITDFRKFSPTAYNLFSIRSEDPKIELAGSLEGYEISAVFPKDDTSVVAYFTEEIKRWHELP